MKVLSHPDGRFLPGWYVLRVRLRPDANFKAPTLTPDEGVGLRLAARIRLTDAGRVRGRTLASVVLLPRAAISCVFADEGLTPDAVDAIELCPIEKYRAALLMAGALTSRLRFSDWAHGSRIAMRNGPRALGDWLYAAYRGDIHGPVAGSYRAWLRLYDELPVLFGGDVAARADAPRISVVVPAYNTKPEHLCACIDSVLAQRYPHWELCIADDASTDPRVPALLATYAARDARIRWMRREHNGHISEATASALAIAGGEIVALLDHDDLLHPDALRELASAFVAHPEWGLVYTDEDKISDAGVRYEPYFKPDFNADLLCAHNCISHLTGIRREWIDTAGGFRKVCDGSQDWDLALRVTELVGPGGVGHIPRVLYHWRAWTGSTAASSEAKPYTCAAALRAIGEHLARTGQEGEVVELPDQPGNYRVIRRIPSPAPLVSVLIPTRDQPDLLERCVRSVDATRGGIECEFLIADNGSVLPRTKQVLAELAMRTDVRVFRDDRPFNFSVLNNSLAAAARGEVLLFLNDDIEACSTGWLEEMVAQACRPEVGAVGAKLHYPDGRIQHAGIHLGVEGIAANAYRGQPADTSGHVNRARLVQELSAVTAACLAMRHEVFHEVGGFDERFAVAYNDVDLCLRVRQAGWRVVWTPHAELVHHESVSRGVEPSPGEKPRVDLEDRLMRERWGDWLDADPAYNPNLESCTSASGLAFPPRR